MVEAGDTTLDLAGPGGGAFGLDGEVAGNVDALPGFYVFDGDACGPDGVDLPDGRPVELADRAPGAPEEDVSQRVMCKGSARSSTYSTTSQGVLGCTSSW